MPAGSIRCFVGLPLPQAWQQALDRVAGRLANTFASRISWTRPGNWHSTLKFLGEVDEARLPALRAALRGIAWSGFPMGLGPAGGFGERSAPRTLWAGLAMGANDCAALAQQIGAALGPLGFATEQRAFRPHVTLGRVKDAAKGDDWSLAGRELAREHFAPARAEEFVLWRSILGPQGPKYAALEVYPARDHGGGPEREGTPR